MATANEAFARVKINTLLAAQGWNTQDTNAVRFEVALPDGKRADYVLCDRHDQLQAGVMVRAGFEEPTTQMNTDKIVDK